MTPLEIALALLLLLALVGVAMLARGISTATGKNWALTRDIESVSASARQAEHDRAQLLQAVDRMPVGTLGIAESGEILFANRAAERFVDARHGDAVVEVLMTKLAQRCAVEGIVVEDEVEVFAGGHSVLAIRAAPVTDMTGVAAIVLIEDRTAQRRIDAIRSDFVANVSHELKTPLGALSLLAETLRDEHDPPTRDRLTDRIASEAKRMSRLIDDVLELSLLESEGAPFERINLSDVVRSALNVVRTIAADNGIEVASVLPADDIYAVGHRAQLESAISNLVENAVKYTAAAEREGGGSVVVEVESDGATATINVCDEGIGIAADHLDRIFERFYRVDRGRSRATGGTGLGLAIVRHVAMNHNGTATVTSEPGVGSQFAFTVATIDPQEALNG